MGTFSRALRVIRYPRDLVDACWVKYYLGKKGGRFDPSPIAALGDCLD